jgi:hypothetical protein
MRVRSMAILKNFCVYEQKFEPNKQLFNKNCHSSSNSCARERRASVTQRQLSPRDFADSRFPLVTTGPQLHNSNLPEDSETSRMENQDLL